MIIDLREGQFRPVIDFRFFLFLLGQGALPYFLFAGAKIALPPDLSSSIMRLGELLAGFRPKTDR